MIGLDHFSPVIGLENYFEMVKNYDIVGLIGARGSQVSRSFFISFYSFSFYSFSFIFFFFFLNRII